MLSWLLLQSLKGAMKQSSALPSSGVALTLETAPQIHRANSDNLSTSGKSILTKPAASWDTSAGGDKALPGGGAAAVESNILNTPPTPVATAKETGKPAGGEFVFSQPSSMPPRG